MNEANRKGLALELSVGAIEAAILKRSPSYNEKTFRIEFRKLITVEGVKHELDVYVTVDIAHGYDATFVFECKNLQKKDKVDKNDIIVFSEKIAVAQAQTGFFVARSYTKDARAQASLDSRIELFTLSDLPVDDVVLPFVFQGVNVENTTVSIEARRKNPKGEGSVEIERDSANLVLNGETVGCDDYINKWIVNERQGAINSWMSKSLPEGQYELTIDNKIEFSPGEIILNGNELQSLTMRGFTTVTLSLPTVVSYFDVESRGRAIALEMRVGTANVLSSFALESRDPD